MDGEIRREIWSITQAVCGLYCASIGTWAVFHPPTVVLVQQQTALGAEAHVTPHLALTIWQWFLLGGFLVCAVTLTIGTIGRFLPVRSKTKPSASRDQETSATLKKVEDELGSSKKELAEVILQRDQAKFELAIAEGRVRQLDKEAGSRIKLPLTQLETDALYMSVDLLNFLKELGPAPPPRYTAKDINDMASTKMKELIESGDVDYAEACEYHGGSNFQTNPIIKKQIINKWKLKYPWYQLMEAGYALRFKERVETLRNRLLLAGIADDTFRLPVEYRDGAKNILAMAAKLWELAFMSLEKRMMTGETS